MGMNWRNISEEKPIDGQDCLTKMKHGILQGQYSAKYDLFEGYYWTDMEWFAPEWVPVEEAN